MCQIIDTVDILAMDTYTKLKCRQRLIVEFHATCLQNLYPVGSGSCKNP